MKIFVLTISLILTSFLAQKSEAKNKSKFPTKKQQDASLIGFYDSILKQEAQKKFTNPDEFYEIYMNAAKDLQSFGHYRHANRYFREAAMAENRPGTVEAHIKVLETYRQLGQRKNHRKWVKKTIKYFKKKKIHKTNSWYRKLVVENRYSKGNTRAIAGRKLANAKKHFTDKNFKQSFSILEKVKMTQAPFSLKVFFDLNKVLLGKLPQKLECEETYKKHSSSKSYNIQICKLLLTIKKTRKVDYQLAKKIKNKIQSSHPEMGYLLAGLAELRPSY